MIAKFKKNKFLFEELVKRDFTKKYKRTILGMVWSVLNPLMNLLIMWLVLGKLFSINIDHYVVYLFAGNLTFAYFSDATNLGMVSLISNSVIFSKINIPKYLFLFSANVSALINYALTLIIFFGFVALEGIPFTWRFFLLLYPVLCLIIFNVGMGLILSALHMFFRDMQYLWTIFSQLIMWMSAIFYTVDIYSPTIQKIFLLNPIYVYISYFREIVIKSSIPSLQIHILAAIYALIAFGIGSWFYKKYNNEFLYYI